jgi:RNA polymerase sigma-32 factor
MNTIKETQTESATSRYIAQVRAIPSLSREQEVELCRRWQNEGDCRAKDELIRANLRVVVFMALKYRAYGLPMSELISDGNIGLLQAVERFEPERGMRFMSYAAYWIRAAILSAIVRSWSLVNTSSESFRKMFFKLRRERARVASLVGDDQEVLSILAERFGTSRERIADMLGRLESRDVSLDATTSTEWGSTELIDTLADPGPNQEQAYVFCEEEYRAQKTLLAALRTLDARERVLIQNRFMVDTEDELSLAEMGRRMGVGRERARQLQERARKKLRQRLSDFSIDWPTFGSAA